MAMRRRQRFGQVAHRPRQHEQHPQQQHPEDRPPSQRVEQRAADNRRDRRRDAEDQRDLRHQPLRLRAVESVADDRAADDESGSRAGALGRAKHPQCLDIAGDRAAQRRERVDGQAGDDDRPATQCVGQRAMPQHHECVGEQVGRKRLLHGDRRCRELGSDGGKGRQVEVDRERTEHRQRGDQPRHSPRTLVHARRRRGHRVPRDAHFAALPSSAASTAARPYFGANIAMNAYTKPRRNTPWRSPSRVVDGSKRCAASSFSNAASRAGS